MHSHMTREQLMVQQQHERMFGIDSTTLCAYTNGQTDTVRALLSASH